MWILLLVTLINACDPYGFRISLGHYYTQLNNSMDKIRVTFNSNVECSDIQLVIDDTINPVSTTYSIDSKYLNMTKIYENTKYHFDYGTYIYNVQIGINELLKDGGTYNYYLRQIVNSKIISETYTFRVPDKYTMEHTYLVMGDLDSNWANNVSKPTFDWLQKQIDNNVQYDAILYMGDMAYDLETDNCQYGEYFIKNITMFASKYPLMPTAGNHDQGENERFDYYRANFIVPSLREYDTDVYYNDFFSLDIGNAHIVQFNAYQFEYNEPHKAEYRRRLYQILKNDLEKANKNRDQIPWLILYNHYPMHCTSDDDFCTQNHQIMSEFNTLFYDNQVDLYLCSHQHTYERDQPYYQYKLQDYEANKDQSIITKWGSFIQVIEGTAGNAELMPEQINPSQIFSASQAYRPGIGILTIKNQTHLHYEHRLSDSDRIVDQFWLIKYSNTIESNNNHFILYFIILMSTLILFGIIILCIISCKRYYQIFVNNQVITEMHLEQ